MMSFQFNNIAIFLAAICLSTSTLTAAQESLNQIPPQESQNQDNAPKLSIDDVLKNALSLVAAQAAEEEKPVPLDLRQIVSIKGTRFNSGMNESQSFELFNIQYASSPREFTGKLGYYWNGNSSVQPFTGKLKDNGRYIISSQFSSGRVAHGIIIDGKIVDGKFEGSEGSYARLNGVVIFKD
jgi:hypothetical protein